LQGAHETNIHVRPSCVGGSDRSREGRHVPRDVLLVAQSLCVALALIEHRPEIACLTSITFTQQRQLHLPIDLAS
ncbi:MAG: hypothetical protein RL033_1605, partial [Pseudomonadota bacterium]